MNKQELNKAVHGSLDPGLKALTLGQVEGVIDSLFNVVERQLVAKDTITIKGFGTFSTRHRKATTKTNPKTKAKVDVDAKEVPKLKFSPSLTEKINGVYDAGKKPAKAPKPAKETKPAKTPGKKKKMAN